MPVWSICAKCGKQKKLQDESGWCLSCSMKKDPRLPEQQSGQNPPRRLMLKHCKDCGAPAHVKRRYPSETYTCPDCTKINNQRAVDRQRAAHWAAKGMKVPPRKGEIGICQKPDCDRQVRGPKKVCATCAHEGRLKSLALAREKSPFCQPRPKVDKIEAA